MDTDPAPEDRKVASSQPPADEVTALKEEVHQLHQAVRSHAVVDQAIGVLMTAARTDADQGFTVLREVSQHTNIKLHRVAELIVTGR
ncbi:ANTAR domain-containing protein [Streptomyces sp. NBC_01210]|uniref:ANTAR domain-containing protein n=1 Tax=Streptomyces sp. NBC_01210 TaxID=2903774 RepID=UPI002E0E290A